MSQEKNNQNQLKEKHLAEIARLRNELKLITIVENVQDMEI